MYGQSLSAEDFREICDQLAKEKHILAAQHLKEKFSALMRSMCRDEPLEEDRRTAFILTPDRITALRDAFSSTANSKTTCSVSPSMDFLPAGSNGKYLEFVFYHRPKIYPVYSVRPSRSAKPLRCEPGNTGAAESGTVA